MTSAPNIGKIIDKSFILKLDEIMSRPPDWSDPFRAVDPEATEYTITTPQSELVTFRIEPDLPLVAKANYWIVHSSDEFDVAIAQTGQGAFPPHRHPEIVQWCFIHSGSVYLLQPDGRTLQEPGTVAYIGSNDPHTVMVAPGCEYVINFQVTFPGKNFKTVPLVDGPEYDGIAQHMREISAEY